MLLLTKFAVSPVFTADVPYICPMTGVRRRRFWLFAFWVSLSCTAHAQLDSIHWIPPMHARTSPGPQYLYLSTPESTPFPVSLGDGAGAFFASINISNGQPARVDLGSDFNTQVLVPEDSLLAVLYTKGLILEGPKKFYVNFRYHSSDRFQANDLTCKGQAALGKTFRIGHLFQSTSTSSGRSNFVGVLATEDSTRIKLTPADLSVKLQKGSVPLSGGPAELVLMKGQSAVFSQYIGSSASQPPNGLLGALLESSKPIAVNVGSWLGSPENGSNDSGIDQIVPFEQVGKEYILCKGNGANDMETPLVIAHKNNTVVWLNDVAQPRTTLQAGQYIRLSGNDYSAGGNLYIQTSEPAYIYQITGGVPSGNDIYRTGGLIFVPPVSCGIPNKVDNIYLPNSIGDMIFDGGLTIVAMKDSMVTVRIDGNDVALGAPAPVLGNPDFVTYRRIGLFSSSSPSNTASVVANGAVQVALIGRNGAAGYGAFYSGFSKTAKPTLKLTTIGDGVCPDTLVASGKFDGVQWYYADSLMFYGPDTFYVAYAPGEYIARGYLGVCRRTDFVEDTVVATFRSPEFPHTFTEPSCFGFADGSIAIGTPAGGLEPYSYSIDKGKSYRNTAVFNSLRAGHYDLVVRDSTGCYNRPLALDIAQPDSFTVDLGIVRIDEPVLPGDAVYLEAIPGRPAVRTSWAPVPHPDNCPDCLRYTANPEKTTLYAVTVYDAEGCPASDSLLIAVQPRVFAPNAIRPESSDGNDRFTLFSEEALPIKSMRIFDRWGELVFENQNFMSNDPAAGWDGTRPGKDAPAGVYAFKAEVEYVPGRVILVEGDLTVVR